MALVGDMAPPPTRPIYTGREMYRHIINLTSADIRYRWQHTINHWNAQEESDFRLGVRRNSIDLTSQMHIFDDLIFDSQLKDRVSVSWKDEMADHGDCTWLLPPRRFAFISLDLKYYKGTLLDDPKVRSSYHRFSGPKLLSL